MSDIDKKHVFASLAVFAAVAVLAILGAFLQGHTRAAVTVTRGKAVEAVYATAVVEPVRWAAIAPIMTGRVMEINMEEGDRVKAGDILARLDDSDLRAQLEENRAVESYHAAEVQRAESLIKKGALSEDKYDQRQTSLVQVRARISMLEHQIRQLALVSPMDGTVLWRDVELGEVKEAGKPVFWVGQPVPLRLESEVDEEDIPKIKIGQAVLVTADAFPGEVIQGALQWISPKGDPLNKSYRAYVSLPEDTKLMVGMTVETNMIVQEKSDVLLVSSGAVLDGGFVWRAEPGTLQGYTARKVSVKTGIASERLIEIIDGVAEGDILFLPPFDGLADGAAVQPDVSK